MKNPYSTKIYKYDVNNAHEHHLQQFDDTELENLDTEEHLQHLLEEAYEKCLPRKKEFLEREDTDEIEEVQKLHTKKCKDAHEKEAEAVPKDHEIQNLGEKLLWYA